MAAKDRKHDRNWDTYYVKKEIGKCKCGKGVIKEIYFEASHEKVIRIERDYCGTEVFCNNDNCPSKN